MNDVERRMEVDVRGRVRNVSVGSGNALLPLFEAVVNGIHATEERLGDDVRTRGQVEVRVHRLVNAELSLSPGRPPIPEVTGFTVIDNGSGFTDANMDAFCKSDTTAKAELGGKGVGRFSWLVVFKRAKVESIYADAAGNLRRRAFQFLPSERGVEDYTDEDAEADPSPRTQVELRGVELRFKEGLRIAIEVMAERLFEHCFSYFVVGRCPRIRMVEEGLDGATIIDVNDKLGEVRLSPVVLLRVGVHDLNVLHAQQKHAQGRKHSAHLCAHRRVVTSFPLAEVSELSSDPITLEDGQRVVEHVYVSGPPLDAAVDSTRTRLDLPDGLPLLEAAGELDLKALRQALGAHVNAHLSDTLRVARGENLAKIEHHIRTQQPEYRHLLARIPERLQRVKYTGDARALDERLYREKQAWEAEVRRRQAEVERLAETSTDPSLLAEELAKVMEEVNEAGRGDLVRYVAKRRAVLRVVGALLGRGVLEEHIHRLIFPMRTTADQIAYDDHNLWLVDDTLSFYEHVASDITFTKNEAAPTDGAERPDLLAFKTGDPPYQHIALVEFKRPERRDDNPVEQLVRYAVSLRKGGAKNVQGQTMPGIPHSVRIDAFALATLSPTLEDRLRVGPGNMVKAEGDWRWYGGVPAENLSIEVLDFQTFVRRAEQRNRAFFVKLGLS